MADKIDRGTMRRFMVNPFVIGGVVAGSAAAVSSLLRGGVEEYNQNKPLADPLNGGINLDKSIQATQTAVAEKGWETMINEGFPKLAITTANKITISNVEYTAQGSGSLMHHSTPSGDFLVDITCGHLFDAISEPNTMQIVRSGNLPFTLDFSFDRKNFAYRHVFEDTHYGPDYGIAVVKIDKGIKPFLPPTDQLIHFSDLEFEKISLAELTHSEFCSIGYPTDSSNRSMTEPQIMINAPARLVENIDPVRTNINLDDTRSRQGASGSGVFIKGDMTKNNKLIGINTATSTASYLNMDTSVVCPLSLIGKDEFNRLLDECVSELG